MQLNITNLRVLDTLDGLMSLLGAINDPKKLKEHIKEMRGYIAQIEDNQATLDKRIAEADAKLAKIAKKDDEQDKRESHLASRETEVQRRTESLGIRETRLKGREVAADSRENDLDAAALPNQLSEMQAERDALQEQLEEAQEALEAAKSGGSELEKLKRDLEKIQTKQEAAMKALDAEKQAHQATKRATAISRIAGQIPWMDGVNDKYRQTVVDDATAELDIEDFQSPDMVKAVVEKLKSEQAHFIASDVKPGAGSAAGKGKDTSPAGGSEGGFDLETFKSLLKSDPEAAKKYKAAGWDEARAGYGVDRSVVK